jgi:filamentous hemagglutinin family protein
MERTTLVPFVVYLRSINSSCVNDIFPIMIDIVKYKYLIDLAVGTVFFSSLNLQNNFVLAQITPDNTLGSEKSQVNSPSPQEKRIEGGATRGSNLFHSFREFNVDEAETVNFANPQGLANIFSRVTGHNISEIMGDLGVLGDANLFLINPHGIIFGERASLNVNGSFIATTASSIKFADGNQFSANPTSQKSLLTINVPIGLQFGNQPGKIINQAQSDRNGLVGLKIKSNQTLALIGGEIILQGGNLTATGGHIELGSVDANSLVGLDFTESGMKFEGMKFDYSAVENFLDITATDRQALVNDPSTGMPEEFPISSIVDAASDRTIGSINLQGKNINIFNGSQILTPTQGDTPGGNLIINAEETLTLSGFLAFSDFPSAYSKILTSTVGNGDAGNIRVTTKNLIVRDNASIDSKSANFITKEEVPATGDAGNININSSELIVITDRGSINSSSVGQGKAGNIFIQARSLKLDNNSVISAATTQSDGGNITLKVNDNLELRNQSNLSASVGGTGNGGNINIDTRFLITSPQDNSDIITTAKFGIGGNISIKALGVFGTSEQDKLTQFSDLTASSDFGTDGTVILSNYYTTLKTTETDSGIQLAKVPFDFTPNSCYATRHYQKNKYVQTGRGGIPLDAKDSLTTEHTWEDWRILEQESSQKVKTENLVSHDLDSSSINPIQGWTVDRQGKIILTANPIMVTPHPPEIATTGCY